MKKLLIPILAIITLIISCQKDDICIDPVTPNLIIRFYDNDDPTEYKSVSNLFVWAEDLDTIYEGVSTDSIAIPLNPAQDFTIYHLSSGTIQDDITIDYTRNEVFVSRSCGYKYNFSDLNLSGVTNNWILNTEITNQTVEDETEHIKILH
ncbi:MAG: hypothetical protein ACI8RP_001315 [Urechidicola sp.]|jgi:hypothetical protein|tara:strand:+ start:1004 stop:1453 length:450 start_codon:yes stop_codon:yes gene_type:complete